MENHPIYKPRFEFTRQNFLTEQFFRNKFFVWESETELPTLWTFYREANVLVIESKSGEKKLKWSILPHLKLLSIQDPNQANNLETNYEIWENADSDYCELRAVLNEKTLFLMREMAVNSLYRYDLIHTLMSDVEQTEDYQVNTYLATEAHLEASAQREGCFLYLVLGISVLFFVIWLESLTPVIVYLAGFLIFPTLYTATAVKRLRNNNLAIVQNPRIPALESSLGGYIVSGGLKSYLLLFIIAVIIYLYSDYLLYF
jgi:hypothetical protein